jgi:hypothetical protein
MDIGNEDLSKLPYDVNTLDFLRTYPKLTTIPEFQNRDEIKNFNNLFRYILLLYTPNTPLLQISDYSERKQYAQEYSRATKDDIAGASLFIIGYLRTTKADKWSKLCVYRDALYNQALRLQSDDTKSGERTAALIQNIELLETKIESTLASIAAGDKKIEAEIIGFVEEERLQDLRPENRVANILAGKPAMEYNPYQKRGRGRPKRVE